MSLLRVLIPSWKFFDQPGSISELFFQTSQDGRNWSAWTKPLAPPIRRDLAHLLLNSWGNAWLAEGSLVEKLCFEFFESQKQSLNELRGTPAYKLVENWIRVEMRNQKIEAKYFLFKIEITEASPASSSITTLASGPHEA